jgi:hypothetical protein
LVGGSFAIEGRQEHQDYAKKLAPADLITMAFSLALICKNHAKKTIEIPRVNYQ